MGEETELFMRGRSERELCCRGTFRRDQARELVKVTPSVGWQKMRERGDDENFPFFESCFGADRRVQR
jgi:hypothetical protein